MYGKKRFRSVDELHQKLFLMKYKRKNDSLVNKVRKLNSVTLPPSSRVILKSEYIAGLWKNCLNVNPQSQYVLSFGWRMKDGHCNILWFDSDAAPKLEIWKNSKKLYYQFQPIIQLLESHFTEAKIFQVDNSQLKDGSIWN